jgi:hypothetical protein
MREHGFWPSVCHNAIAVRGSSRRVSSAAHKIGVGAFIIGRYIDNMEDWYRYVGIAFYAIIPLGVLALCINIIYRKIRNKNICNSGTSFVGEYMYMLWETKGKRGAVEEIQYERDQKQDDAESGDPPEMK